MSVVVNEVRRGAYLDSVALMRIAASIKAQAGIEECGLMMGTPANLRILDEAGVLAEAGERAGPGDVVIALRATDRAAAEAAIAEARSLLDRPRTTTGTTAAWQPRTSRSAVAHLPAANLALVSVPGAFAAPEAMKALRLGLNVMVFSDNVPIKDEIALKHMARRRGALLMGPDCGTAIIAGVPLGFANEVPRGEIGIVGASGTGIQEVACLIARAGGGISHAIGTGGRDLKREVGGITTLMAIDLLDRDPSTRHIVVISKPPDPTVAAAVLDRARRSAKPFTLCFVGTRRAESTGRIRTVATLEDAASSALGDVRQNAETVLPPGMTLSPRGGLIRGLFAGGTLCAEAQVPARDAGLGLASNAPIDGVGDAGVAGGDVHTFIDLGDDAYTLGRPHPMIEPSVRDAPLDAALADPRAGVLLLDCVLGHGSHPDPAGHLARRLATRAPGRPPVVASVTGTEADPQRLSAQRAVLEGAGVLVAHSNAEAARIAVRLATRADA
jgi:FdrA protein